LAQDNPFDAPPAEANANDPFSVSPEAAPESPFGAPNANAPADPFAVAPPAGEASPFSDAPAAPITDTASPFTENVPPPTEPIDPFAATTGPNQPVDPFASAASPGAMDSSVPRIDEIPPAQPATDNPFGFDSTGVASTSPFGTESVAPGASDGSIFSFDAPATAGATGTQGGISTLYDFRYIEVPRIRDESVIVRRRMTVEEAREWDKEQIAIFVEAAANGEYPLFNPGVQTAEDWAEWMLYADQVDKWDRYVRNVVLVGTEYSEQESTISWPGDRLIPQPAEEGGNQGGNFGDEASLMEGGGRQSRNIYNENRSLDEQLYDFNPLADTRPGKQGQTVYDPKQMDDQSVALYGEYMTQLREYELSQVAFMQQLERDLETRRVARESYQEWREAQIAKVLDFVHEWERRYEGKVTTIAGVRYELYRPENVPQVSTRGANIVVTDYDLTPYDILNEDGTLRGPSRQ
jgi:hypothetical protein